MPYLYSRHARDGTQRAKHTHGAQGAVVARHRQLNEAEQHNHKIDVVPSCALKQGEAEGKTLSLISVVAIRATTAVACKSNTVQFSRTMYCYAWIYCTLFHRDVLYYNVVCIRPPRGFKQVRRFKVYDRHLIAKINPNLPSTTCLE